MKTNHPAEKTTLLLQAPNKMSVHILGYLFMVLSIFIPAAELYFLYHSDYPLGTAHAIISISLIIILLIDLRLGFYLNFRYYTKLEIDKKEQVKYYIPAKVSTRHIESALELEFPLQAIEKTSFIRHPFTRCGKLTMCIVNPVSHSNVHGKVGKKRLDKAVTRSLIITEQDLRLLNERRENDKI